MNRPELQNIMTHNKDALARSPGSVLKQGVIRPLRLLTQSPIVFFLSLYMAFIFGLLYLLFTTITEVYIVTYGWSPQLCGLAYLGLGVGFFAGLLFVARTSDATIIRLTKKNKVYEPEYRLAPCLGFGFFIPISFFWCVFQLFEYPIHKLIHFQVWVVHLLQGSLDRSHHRPYPLRLRLHGCLYANSNLHCRFLSPVRGVRHGRNDVPAYVVRCCTPAGRSEYVSQSRSGVGEQSTRVCCSGHDPGTSADFQVWYYDAEEVASEVVIL